jgi:hypothetical protein
MAISFDEAAIIYILATVFLRFSFPRLQQLRRFPKLRQIAQDWRTIAFKRAIGRLPDLLNKTTDMTGRKVRVPLRVNRVLSPSGAMDEWLLLLGGPEKLVATLDTIPLGNEECFPGGFLM